jgi:hypothetical protein
MPTAERRYVCQFLCNGEEHTFVLPRRSPLGIFDDPQNQPKGSWPIIFLCLPHRHACEVTLDTIHPDSVQTVAQGLHEASLWQIEFECVQGNCGLRQTIYTRYSRDGKPSDVERSLRDASHVIACKGGHRAVVRWETLRVELLG